MIKVVALACCLCALSACATRTSSKLINLPDGQSGFALNCSGSDASSSWADCYRSAGNACGPAGYDIVSKDGDEGGTTGGSVNGLFSANVRNRAMIVRCH
ncbi:MAG: hypothetical protein ACRYG5_16800 [Janthinobacterium lividum]